ncbi:MAG: helix-turn-helix transcriptional regulator [Bacteroidota bacterium]
MNSFLVTQLKWRLKWRNLFKSRMKRHNLSIGRTESKANLNPHAVRNILTGKSNQSSAVNLQKISDILGCSIKDLLSEPPILEDGATNFSIKKVLQTKYSEVPNRNLLSETIKVVESLIQKKDITIDQFFMYVKEVYIQSVQQDPTKVEKEFAAWFVGLDDE